MARPAMSVRYSRIAIVLHWFIALAIILLLFVGKYMTDLSFASQGELKMWLYQYHKSLGITVLALSLLRIVWRLGHRPPPLPDKMPAWEKLAAHGTHLAFYGIMIGMPLIGWAMVSTTTSPTQVFGLFDLPSFPGLSGNENSVALENRFKTAHIWLANGTIALIVLHVVAALRHHFVLKDGTLGRMLPFVKGQANDN